MKRILLIILVSLLIISSIASAQSVAGNPFRVIQNQIDIIIDDFVHLSGDFAIERSERIGNDTVLSERVDNEVAELQSKIDELEARVAALETCTQGMCGQPYCSDLGEICGGMAGLLCCGGFECQFTDTDGSDPAGVCVASCTPEVCDGVDNDCDGQLDEEITAACGLTDVGICSMGTQTCNSGVLGPCVGAVYPQMEECDGLDNNCDGSIDETPAVIFCSMNHVQFTPVCVSGRCMSTCSSGFGDCNYGAVNDGCETNTNTDVYNCGGCGVVCSSQNSVQSCMAGVCAIASCNAGYGNCNGNVADGCETTTNADASNCDGCGIVCGAGTTCNNGICAP